MQGINLARRPFVNRRPVLRLAILLWIAGAALAVHNFRQFTGHWQGTKEYRLRLIDIDREIREEREKLSALDQKMARVSLRRENQHTTFLNRLISYRTFPWSSLFDDLEEVIPRDVKLNSVKPDVKLKAESKTSTRQRRARSRQASTRNAADTAGSESPASAQDADPSRTDPQSLRRDEVRLQLNGVAKTEDAVVEFIEVLYASPSFRSPHLPGEVIESGGTVKFTLSTIYLTGGRNAVPEPADAEPTDAVALAQTSEDDGSTPATLAETEGEEAEAALDERDPTTGESDRRPSTGARGNPAREAAASQRTESRRAGPRRGASPSRRGASEPRRGTSAETPGGTRPQTLPGAGGVALPGAAASDPSAAPDASGTSSRPTTDQPSFAQPAASATPELRRGTLTAPWTTWPPDVSPVLAAWEARA